MKTSDICESFLKYPAQLPRYTSYPTAPHFYPMTPDAYASRLEGTPPATPLSLYVHIPYCPKMCWFCGCHTQATQRYEPVADYLMLLKKEMTLLRAQLGIRGKVSHVHFGGGSPGMLSAGDFGRLVEEMHKAFDVQPAAEIAMELDPRGVSEAKVAAYKRHGVNRISLGVQDFNLSVQEAIGRVQPFRTVYDTLKLCRDYDIPHVNMDLIYGLPKQTIESVTQTAEYTAALSPDRITLFGYAHVPWKKKNIRLIDEESLPDSHQRLAMFAAAAAVFKKAGYLKIGIDHFAKPEDAMAAAWKNRTLHRNFQGYTTDNCDTLIGIGASAIGSFPWGYAQNTANATGYHDALIRGALPIARGYILSEEDRVRSRIIESLMCYEEVDIVTCCRGTSIQASGFDASLQYLEQAEKDGLLQRDGYHIRINPLVPQAARIASVGFDSFFSAETGRHAQVS